MADLQNISFSTAPALRVTRIRVEFQYRANVTDQWRTFTYLIPDDMFDIRPDDRERIAIDLIRAIAIGKGHMDEDGNVLV